MKSARWFQTYFRGALALMLSSTACSDDGDSADGSTTAEPSGTSAPSPSTGMPTPTTDGTTTQDDADGDGTATDDGDGTTEGTDSSGGRALPCNGHVELCDRPYDQVVFAGTHNSHAATDAGFPIVNANHVRGIADQLDDGVRVMLLDIYPDNSDPNAILLCHGPCELASTPHLQELGVITDFLVENPREIVTIIYQDAVGVDVIAGEFAAAGADALVYSHAPGSAWPTLGEMIDADTRLVITAESGGPPPDWYHHVWDEAWDTPYGPTSIDDLSCDLNRGSPDHDLFLVNHWVNNIVGLPSQSNAAEANATDVLLGRAQECWRQWDHPPNFLVVDFYEEGDLFSVVDTLNGV